MFSDRRGTYHASGDAIDQASNTGETMTMDKKAVLGTLNSIMEFELAGVVRYTHYALMVFGYNRIPIVKWLHEQATESLAHASQAGELVTWLGGHPSLGIGPLLETHSHTIEKILDE